MKNGLLKSIFSVALGLQLLFSCSTDVDLQGEWQDITVVYGILDQSDTKHFVKINKTFNGQGNALAMAAVRDSSEYDPNDIYAYIEEKSGATVLRTFPLRDTTIGGRENGVFYGPEQTLYYFEANDLDSSRSYWLTIEVNSNPDEPKVVRCSTELVNGFPITKPQANIPGAPSQPQLSLYSGTFYSSIPVEWNTGQDGRRYEAKVVLNYEEYSASDTVDRQIELSLGSAVSETLDGGEKITKSLNGEAFYQWVYDEITSNDALNNPDVLQRRFRGIDVEVTVAGDDLNTYMEVNEPVTGVVQERPVYTNVDNGIGIFSARHSVKITNKYLNKNSLQELTNGQYTYSLNFCTDSVGLWPNNSSDPSFCQ